MQIHYRKILLGVIVPLSLGAILILAFLQAGGLAQANPAAQMPAPTDPASAAPAPTGTASQTPTPTATDPVLAALSSQIEQYASYLKEDLAPDVRQNVQAKKKYLERQATERANNLAHSEEAWIIKQTAIAEASLTPRVPGKGMPTLAPGLYTEISSPLMRYASFSNAWVVHTQDTFVIYYAGDLVHDPDQGVLYIENRTNGSSQMLYMLRGEGALRIASVDNNRLHLESKKGSKYFFDMDQAKFGDETGSLLPEAVVGTPAAPTNTPAPAYPAPATATGIPTVTPPAYPAPR